MCDHVQAPVIDNHCIDTEEERRRYDHVSCQLGGVRAHSQEGHSQSDQKHLFVHGLRKVYQTKDIRGDYAAVKGVFNFHKYTESGRRTAALSH